MILTLTVFDWYTRVTDGRTDRRTDGIAIAYALSILCCRAQKQNSWARTRGAQLTAGYTVNTYSKPPLYYTLGAVAPLLPCLRTAAVLRTAHTLGPGGPLRGQTDWHATDTTYQPANRTVAVLPVPSCKLGNDDIRKKTGLRKLEDIIKERRLDGWNMSYEWRTPKYLIRLHSGSWKDTRGSQDDQG